MLTGAIVRLGWIGAELERWQVVALLFTRRLVLVAQFRERTRGGIVAGPAVGPVAWFLSLSSESGLPFERSLAEDEREVARRRQHVGVKRAGAIFVFN